MVYISDGLDTVINIKYNRSKRLRCGSTPYKPQPSHTGVKLSKDVVFMWMYCLCGCSAGKWWKQPPLCVRTEFIVPAWASRVAAPCTWRIVGAIWGRDRCTLGCFFSAHCACTAVWLTQWARGKNVCVWSSRQELNKMDFGRRVFFFVKRRQVPRMCSSLCDCFSCLWVHKFQKRKK